MSLPAVIETPRLTLRPPEPRHVPAIVAAVGDWEVVRWLSRVPHPYDEADAERFLAWAAEEPGVWAIEAEGGLRGVVSIRDDLGYWLARDAWGRGWASEAAGAVVEAWFAAGHRVLASSHMEGNDASRRVLTKLGFRDVGPKRIASLALGRETENRAMRLER